MSKNKDLHLLHLLYTSAKTERMSGQQVTSKSKELLETQEIYKVILNYSFATNRFQPGFQVNKILLSYDLPSNRVAVALVRDAGLDHVGRSILLTHTLILTEEEFEAIDYIPFYLEQTNCFAKSKQKFIEENYITVPLKEDLLKQNNGALFIEASQEDLHNLFSTIISCFLANEKLIVIESNSEEEVDELGRSFQKDPDRFHFFTALLANLPAFLRKKIRIVTKYFEPFQEDLPFNLIVAPSYYQTKLNSKIYSKNLNIIGFDGTIFHGCERKFPLAELITRMILNKEFTKLEQFNKRLDQRISHFKKYLSDDHLVLQQATVFPMIDYKINKLLAKNAFTEISPLYNQQLVKLSQEYNKQVAARSLILVNIRDLQKRYRDVIFQQLSVVKADKLENLVLELTDNLASSLNYHTIKVDQFYQIIENILSQEKVAQKPELVNAVILEIVNIIYSSRDLFQDKEIEKISRLLLENYLETGLFSRKICSSLINMLGLKSININSFTKSNLEKVETQKELEYLFDIIKQYFSSWTPKNLFNFIVNILDKDFIKKAQELAADQILKEIAKFRYQKTNILFDYGYKKNLSEIIMYVSKLCERKEPYLKIAENCHKALWEIPIKKKKADFQEFYDNLMKYLQLIPHKDDKEELKKLWFEIRTILIQHQPEWLKAQSHWFDLTIEFVKRINFPRFDLQQELLSQYRGDLFDEHFDFPMDRIESDIHKIIDFLIENQTKQVSNFVTLLLFDLLGLYYSQDRDDLFIGRKVYGNLYRLVEYSSTLQNFDSYHKFLKSLNRNNLKKEFLIRNYYCYRALVDLANKNILKNTTDFVDNLTPYLAQQVDRLIGLGDKLDQTNLVAFIHNSVLLLIKSTQHTPSNAKPLTDLLLYLSKARANKKLPSLNIESLIVYWSAFFLKHQQIFPRESSRSNYLLSIADLLMDSLSIKKNTEPDLDFLNEIQNPLIQILKSLLLKFNKKRQFKKLSMEFLAVCINYNHTPPLYTTLQELTNIEDSSPKIVRQLAKKYVKEALKNLKKDDKAKIRKEWLHYQNELKSEKSLKQIFGVKNENEE
ncbi:MAG: hypothetical protein GF364_16740 [Candidatus Lokiarchaeota archaeon]|nr:hypothetical protein [Candidatus Lokiarchaeota archaeon]